MNPEFITALEAGGFALMREGDTANAVKLLARALLERTMVPVPEPASLDAWREKSA